MVDVYQEWAGPCKAMISNFRRLKNELGDDLLRFAVVSDAFELQLLESLIVQSLRLDKCSLHNVCICYF